MQTSISRRDYNYYDASLPQRKKNMSSRGYKDATSKTDLMSILTQCSVCRMSTDAGKFIMTHSELPNIKLKNYKQLPVLNFVINTLSSQILDNYSSIGHWFNIIVLRQSGNFHRAIIFNGLGDTASDQTVMQNINKFCSNNSLKCHNESVRYQRDESSLCGYVSLGVIAYTHGKKKLSDITRLKKIFLRNSVKTNENLILKIYHKHFKH